VQLIARSPTVTSKDKSFLGGRSPSSSPQTIGKQTSFIANSRASMKGSPLVAHYLPTDEQYGTSPNTRERTTTVSLQT
jgi:hypothetical protein